MSNVNPRLPYLAYTNGDTKLFIALPNLGMDKHNPSAILTYPPANQCDIIAA